MLVSVVPSTQQVRWYVEGALGCWETLDGYTAAHECQRTLRALLSYLGSVDGTLDLPSSRYLGNVCVNRTSLSDIATRRLKSVGGFACTEQQRPCRSTWTGICWTTNYPTGSWRPSTALSRHRPRNDLLSLAIFSLRSLTLALTRQI